RIIDVDGHFLEPKNWLATQRPDVAEQLPGDSAFDAMVEKWAGYLYWELPPECRPATYAEMVPAGTPQFLRDTTDLQPDDGQAAARALRADGDARLRFLESHGVDVQYLSPTFLNREWVLCRRMQRFDLARDVTEAWNRWALEQVDGRIDRLNPV